MVPTVPITPTRPVSVARKAARSPGSMTLMTGTSRPTHRRSRPAAAAVLQATTTIFTSCSPTSLPVI